MTPNKQAYIRLTADLVLHFLKMHTNLPKDAEAVALIESPKEMIDLSTALRIIFTSESLREVRGGENIPLYYLHEEK